MSGFLTQVNGKRHTYREMGVPGPKTWEWAGLVGGALKLQAVPSALPPILSDPVSYASEFFQKLY